MNSEQIANELVLSSTKALKWLIEYMGEDEWHERRRNVVQYFKKISDHNYGRVREKAHGETYDRIAFHDDWLAWYLYLIESQLVRPTSGDATQLARILPSFASIGRSLELLKQAEGLSARVERLVHRNTKDTDNCLFELLVVTCYVRNGWSVEFIPEDRSNKTPDFKATKGSEEYLVECKRLAKVTEYAETERLEWQKRVKHLFHAMRHFAIPVIAEVNFKELLEDTPETILGQVFFHYMKEGYLDRKETLVLPILDFTVRKLDIEKVNKYLESNDIKPHTPKYIHLLTGSYDTHGNYAVANEWQEACTIGDGKDNELEVLNEFLCKIKSAYVAKWDSYSDRSITLKAKDIKKTLAKAISQLPDATPGIVHIGYETVSGPHIEVSRQKKIFKSVEEFKFGAKDVKAVFCHAMQPLMNLEGCECAETLTYFGNALQILPDNMLIGIDSMTTTDDTHWNQDINRSKGKL